MLLVRWIYHLGGVVSGASTCNKRPSSCYVSGPAQPDGGSLDGKEASRSASISDWLRSDGPTPPGTSGMGSGSGSIGVGSSGMVIALPLPTHKWSKRDEARAAATVGSWTRTGSTTAPTRTGSLAPGPGAIDELSWASGVLGVCTHSRRFSSSNASAAHIRCRISSGPNVFTPRSGVLPSTTR